MLSATSICVVPDHTAILNHAINSTSPSNFTSTYALQKFNHVHGGLSIRRAVSNTKGAPFLRIQISNSVTRHIVFSIPNGSFGADGGVSYGSSDELARGDAYTNVDSEDPLTEVVSSQLGLGLSQNVVNLQNQGDLLDKLRAIQLHLLAMEQWNASRLKLCHGKYTVGATNLIHYIALRSLDVEQINEDLSSIGLLNLETINSCVLPSLSAGIHILENSKTYSLNGKKSIIQEIPIEKIMDKPKYGKLTIDSMRKKRSFNEDSLLGSLRDQRTTHIMVTVGAEVLDNDELITDIIKAGATIIRINCAHGDPSLWSEIIRRVKKSSQMLESPCRVLMDLAGPKLRTGRLTPGPCVMKISPKKSPTGEVIYPAQVWLCHPNSGSPPANLSLDSVIHVDEQEFLSQLKLDDAIEFCDSRGKQRILRILKKIPVFSGVGFIAECSKTAFIQSGTEFYIKGKKKKSLVGFAVDIPPVEKFVRLRVRDFLTISRNVSNNQEKTTVPSNDSRWITCPCGYLFDSVKPGEPIAFDDGKIWGVIQGVSSSEILVSITHSGIKGTKLGSEKSINIPKSNIRFEGLTSKDLIDLDFVSSHADMVGVSFIREVNDVVLLKQELEKRKVRNLGVVLKIETKGGFENLALILIEAMKLGNPIGVMIARGDLAVECGWDRLGDIQEEIVSICEAAHVPVIWATQVLESLVKTGVPTRAEITDVTSGKRASCIMLNKGKHVIEAISTLDTILHSKSKVKSELKPLVLSNLLS